MEHTYKSVLRKNLEYYFSIEEIRTLCFDMEISHENLTGETKISLARELVDYCERHGQTDRLVKQCQELRPQIEWIKTLETKPKSNKVSLITNNFSQTSKQSTASIDDSHVREKVKHIFSLLEEIRSVIDPQLLLGLENEYPEIGSLKIFSTTLHYCREHVGNHAQFKLLQHLLETWERLQANSRAERASYNAKEAVRSEKYATWIDEQRELAMQDVLQATDEIIKIIGQMVDISNAMPTTTWEFSKAIDSLKNEVRKLYMGKDAGEN